MPTHATARHVEIKLAFRRFFTIAALSAVMASAGGCALVGYILKASGADEPKKVNLKAEYDGLYDRTVAVLVNADQTTYFDHPTAPLHIARSVSLRLRADVPGLQVIHPDQMAQFQANNPYWHTLKYSELIKRLKVDRLVYVDLIDFTLRERGNDYVWNGKMVANIGVVEADGEDPDDFAYMATVQTSYPPDETIGVLNSNDETIQAGMLSFFGQQVSDLFHDHKGYE